MTDIGLAIFFSRIKVSSIQVPRTQWNKWASDHLPLIVDLEILK